MPHKLTERGNNMINGALYLDEDLASSIALKFTDHLRQLIGDLRLQMIHVVRPDSKSQSVGSGWVRRTWENEVIEDGKSTITRLLKTENVQFPRSGPAKIFLGDREKETLAELMANEYDLFIEGVENTPDTNDFIKLIDSCLYRNSPCPILIVRKNVEKNRTLILIEEKTDIRRLAEQFGQLMHTGKLSVDMISFKPLKMNKWDSHMSAIAFAEAGEFETAKEFIQDERSAEKNEELFKKALDPETIAALDMIDVKKTGIVNGRAKDLANMLQDYDLVVSPFPAKDSPCVEALASSNASVMFFK